MNNHPLRRILRLLPVAIALVLAGCGNSDGLSGPAHLRLLNISSGYDSLDLYSNNGDNDNDKKLFTGVTEKTISAYTSFKADSYTFKYRKTGVSADLLVNNSTLADGTHTTYVTYGALNRFSLLAINEDVDDPDSGYSHIQVLNTTVSGRFDVYLTGANDSLDDTAASVTSVAGGSGGTATLLSSSYRLRVTNSGSKTDVRLDVPNITLANKGIYAIVLTDTDGGVLVNAVLLPQQGQPTFFDNTASANVRVLNMSTGYSPIDLFTTDSNTTTSTETQQFTGSSMVTNSITDYSPIKADTYTLLFRKHLAAGNLTAQSQTFSETSYTTLVTYGTTNHFTVLPIVENAEAANDGYTKLQVYNTSSGDPLDVYLSGPNDAITDIAPTVAAVQPGAQAADTIVVAGAYRLRVTLAGSKTDIRLDTANDSPSTPANVTLPAANSLATPAATGVMSLILSEAAGGILVSAVALPQKGAADIHANNTVRIRGASGLSNGSAVSMTANGTTFVNRKAALSYIGDTYTILPAGATSVAVSVDNVLQSTTPQNLLPGNDYTLLAYDAGTIGAPVLTTLIADDNHVPTAGYSRVKLINGMSGLQHPLSLAINFSPVADFVEVGKASDPFEFVPVASNQNQIDLTDANNLQSVAVAGYAHRAERQRVHVLRGGRQQHRRRRREPGRDRHAAQGPLGRRRNWRNWRKAKPADA